MTQREGEEQDFISKIARKVPGDIAGPVIIAVAFIATSPSILERLHTEAQVYCYLAFLGIITFCVLFPISLHSISKYRERDRKSLVQTVRELPPRPNISSIVKREIEKAVKSMEES